MRLNKKAMTPETRGTKLSFGSFGLKAESQARVKSNQIESARKVISRTLTKAGKLWIRIFPDRPFTAKAAEVGMGKGKGDPQGYCFEVFPGRVIFEVTSKMPPYVCGPFIRLHPKFQDQFLLNIL